MSLLCVMPMAVVHDVTQDAVCRCRAVRSCTECIWRYCCTGKDCHTLHCLVVVSV